MKNAFLINVGPNYSDQKLQFYIALHLRHLNLNLNVSVILILQERIVS